MREQIQRLHALYIALTGLDVRLDMARENDWVIWLRIVAPALKTAGMTEITEKPAQSPSVSSVTSCSNPVFPPGKTSPEQALELVITHLKRGIREQRRNPGALKFRNLIGQPDYFEEDLAEAKAQLRNQKQTASPKSEALRATGRAVAPPAREARSAAQILAADQAFEEFRKLKGKL